MSHPSIGATKAVEDASKRLEALDVELGELERELSQREHAELQAVQTRAGVDAITAAREAATSARAQLDHVRKEREALLETLPALEAASDRELGIKELVSIVSAANRAAAGTHSLVSELVEILRDPLERLASHSRELVDARARYEQTGRELVPGWHYPNRADMGAVRNWDRNGPERQELEGELRRQRGKSLKAVLEGVKPERPNDPVYMLAWRLVEGVQASQRREDMARAKEQERAAAQAEADEQERRELYKESSIVTAPYTFADEILEAIKGAGIEIRGRDVITERLAGELKGVEVIKLVIPLVETTNAKAALYGALGTERVAEHINFAAASPYGKEYV